MYWISERTTLAVASTRFVRSRSQAMCTLFEVRNSLMGGKVLSLCVLLMCKFLSRLDHETAALWGRAPCSLLGRYRCLGKFSYVFQSFFCSDGGSSRFFRNGGVCRINYTISRLRKPLQLCYFFLFTYIPCILILAKSFYLPTDAQINCLKKQF